MTDVFRAISEAIMIIAAGKHDPEKAHERVKTFYDWHQVATRTERVYSKVMHSRQMELMERIERYVDASQNAKQMNVEIFQDNGSGSFCRTNIHNYLVG